MSSNILKCHHISSNILKSHHISSNILKSHEISSNLMKYHQISSNLINSNFASEYWFAWSTASTEEYCFLFLHPIPPVGGHKWTLNHYDWPSLVVGRSRNRMVSCRASIPPYQSHTCRKSNMACWKITQCTDDIPQLQAPFIEIIVGWNIHCHAKLVDLLCFS